MTMSLSRGRLFPHVRAAIPGVETAQPGRTAGARSRIRASLPGPSLEWLAQDDETDSFLHQSLYPLAAEPEYAVAKPISWASATVCARHDDVAEHEGLNLTALHRLSASMAFREGRAIAELLHQDAVTGNLRTVLDDQDQTCPPAKGWVGAPPWIGSMWRGCAAGRL